MSNVEHDCAPEAGHRVSGFQGAALTSEAPTRVRMFWSKPTYSVGMFFVLLGIRVLTRCELSSWDRPSRSPFARDGEVPSLLHRAAERHGDRDRRPRPPEGTRALQEVIDAATAQGAQETHWSGAYSCGVDVVTALRCRNLVLVISFFV